MGEDLVPDRPFASLWVWATGVSLSLWGTGNEELYDLLFANLPLGFEEYVLLMIHFSTISLTFDPDMERYATFRFPTSIYPTNSDSASPFLFSYP